MIIYTRTPKSKKRKPNAKKRALQESWQQVLNRHATKKPPVIVRRGLSATYKLEVPTFRQQQKMTSLNSDHYDTFRKSDKVYTGDAMLGIGTLHKSNAVPVFSEEEARDQANMRR
jgi:hypothetical protein